MDGEGAWYRENVRMRGHVWSDACVALEHTHIIEV